MHLCCKPFLVSSELTVGALFRTLNVGIIGAFSYRGHLVSSLFCLKDFKHRTTYGKHVVYDF